jgi:Lon protease-like protein
MEKLPLFPLNTVLFPGTPLHLHIFEERYKEMINHCITNKLPFGVTLIKQGVEAFGPLAEPFSIGCTANIYQVQELKTGSMNIVVYGQDRFRVLSIVRDELPYLTGRIKLYPLIAYNKDRLIVNRDKLFSYVNRYTQNLIKAGKTQFDPEDIPENPINLANYAAAILQIAPLEKQRLLSFDCVDDLLSELVEIYKRELVFVRTFMDEKDREGVGPFSIN